MEFENSDSEGREDRPWKAPRSMVLNPLPSNLSVVRLDAPLKVLLCSLEMLLYWRSRDLKSLRTLDLGNNAISRLEAGTFVCLSTLQSLSLSSNRLSTLSNETFFGLGPSVEYLDISGNSIISVAANAFRNLLGPNLRYVALSNNRLVVMPRNTFDNSSSVAVLLASNPLVCLPEGERVTTNDWYWGWNQPSQLPLCPYEVRKHLLQTQCLS